MWTVESEILVQILPLSFNNCEIVVGTGDISLSKIDKILVLIQITFYLIEVNFYKFLLIW